MDKAAKLSPNELIQYFIEAQTNLVAYWRAQNTADYSEQELLQALQQAGGSDAYTSGSDLSTININQLAKDSLNAHLSKAQAGQVEQMVLERVQALQDNADGRFINKSVLVYRLPNTAEVFTAIYRNSDGSFRESNYTAAKVKGHIKHIDLTDNSLFVEPTFLARKLTPNREMIRIAIVNPETLQPQVSIS